MTMVQLRNIAQGPFRKRDRGHMSSSETPEMDCQETTNTNNSNKRLKLDGSESHRNASNHPPSEAIMTDDATMDAPDAESQQQQQQQQQQQHESTSACYSSVMASLGFQLRSQP